MSNTFQSLGPLEFSELEHRFGKENAITILRTLERFEGVREERVAALPVEERLRNVFRLMKENIRLQTRH